MENFIILVILFFAVGAALIYVWKEKKEGRKCIGCPYSGTDSCHCKEKE